MTTIEELLMSAEYILSSGNPNVILCERGIRTFETATRNTLDLSAVPVLKGLTHLPVYCRSQSCCRSLAICDSAVRAAAAVGADGLIVEVHPQPEKSSFRRNAIFETGKVLQLMDELRAITTAMRH